jgi:2,4'-dihydroxyacetophenone dioxygenase
MTNAHSLPWQPISPGFSQKLLRGGGDADARVVLLRLEPGVIVPLHRHEGDVHAFNLAGSRTLLETGETVGPGGYVYEPPGNVDSWMSVGEEPTVVLVVVRGAMETLGEDGNVVERTTTRSATEGYREFLRSAGAGEVAGP